MSFSFKQILTFCAIVVNFTVIAQQVEAIDRKGSVVTIKNNTVTTAVIAPSNPLENDIWFDTTAEVTKVYDGTTWLTINLDALAKKEDSGNKSSDATLADATNTKFPTELAVKTYVDGQLMASLDDDITGVSFDGTNLKVDEGLTTFSANLSGLRDSDWFQSNTTNHATSINQNVYTLGNVGIGTNNPQRGMHLAGGNSVIRLSRSGDTATMIFDRYSGNVDNTLKSFQFGLNASALGTGEFFFADYNENVGGNDFTRIMTFTDGNDVIRYNQYGSGNFTSTTSTYLLGVESDGDVIEVDLSTLGTDNQTASEVNLTDTADNFTATDVEGALAELAGASGSNIYTTNGTLTADRSVTLNNFALNFDSNTLVVSGDDNRVGIGTTSPDAQLDIESSGVPLKITPSVTTPTGTQAGQMFMGSDGILYVYDGVRNKWLSVDRQNISWARGGLVTNQYLPIHNSYSITNGYRMLRNATITGVTAQSGATGSWQLLILRNNEITTTLFVTLSNEVGKHSNNITLDLNEGDYIKAYALGSNINSPIGSIEFAWRK